MPEPIVKCAVCAASPSSTNGVSPSRWRQVRQVIVGNCRQKDRLASTRAPFRSSAKIFSTSFTVAASSWMPSPGARNASLVVAMTIVLSPGVYW